MNSFLQKAKMEVEDLFTDLGMMSTIDLSERFSLTHSISGWEKAAEAARDNLWREAGEA